MCSNRGEGACPERVLGRGVDRVGQEQNILRGATVMSAGCNDKRGTVGPYHLKYDHQFGDLKSPNST